MFEKIIGKLRKKPLIIDSFNVYPTPIKYEAYVLGEETLKDGDKTLIISRSEALFCSLFMTKSYFSFTRNNTAIDKQPLARFLASLIDYDPDEFIGSLKDKLRHGVITPANILSAFETVITEGVHKGKTPKEILNQKKASDDKNFDTYESIERFIARDKSEYYNTLKSNNISYDCSYARQRAVIPDSKIPPILENVSARSVLSKMLSCFRG